jgi:hypothetical protein
MESALVDVEVFEVVQLVDATRNGRSETIWA